jgi:hypothetical protein
MRIVLLKAIDAINQKELIRGEYEMSWNTYPQFIILGGEGYAYAYTSFKSDHDNTKAHYYRGRTFEVIPTDMTSLTAPGTPLK